MNRSLRVALGVLLVLTGVIFTLQGLDVLKGSEVMSGKTLWAVIGPVLALAGAAVILVRPRARS